MAEREVTPEDIYEVAKGIDEVRKELKKATEWMEEVYKGVPKGQVPSAELMKATEGLDKVKKEFDEMLAYFRWMCLRFEHKR